MGDKSLVELLGFGENGYLFFLAGSLIFVRFLVAVNMTPYLGTRQVPGQVKVALSLALTAFVFPIVYPTLQASQMPTQTSLIFVLFLKEAFFGVLMGLINMMVFYGIQSAGSMIDNQRYVANARIFNPALGAQASIFGVYLYQMSIAIFLSMGGHRFFLKALVESFRTVPLLSLPAIVGPTMGTPSGPEIVPLLALITKLSAETLIICLQLSAPVLIAIFVADLVLGITNRIAPMINVFEMGFNIKGFVGVLLVYLALPLMIAQTKYWFQVMIGYFSKVAEVFR